MNSTFLKALVGSIAVAITISLLAMTTTATAQQSNQTRPIIGVLNTQIIERDSLAHKGIRLERDKYVTRYQTEARGLETELREEEQRLTQQRNVLAPEVFQQQAQAFQEKFATAQQESRIKLENLNAVVQQAVIQINQEMMGITSQVAQELGINMVMPQGVILLADPSMDITRPILEILNERLPSVEMQNPEGGSAGAAGAAAAE
ncbi:MAG: OmpH family outer membrane protein [Rhodospirillaceae bacterium]|nr:OmpH family outer membrane protein [Rhodospirillaceae bacterium]